MTLDPKATDEMVERAARNAWFSFVDWNGYPNGMPTWDELPDNAKFQPFGKDVWLDIARATITAYLSALPAAGQEGEWVLVPREPTEAMFRAAHEAMYADPYDETTAVSIGAGWDAAIAASPTPPVPGAEPVPPVRVKPAVKALEWDENPHRSKTDTIVGTFWAEEELGEVTWTARDLAFRGWKSEGHGTREAAKAAVQAHYDEIILSALEADHD